MPEDLYLQLVEKMLSAPEVQSKMDKDTVEKLKKLLSGSKMPSKNDIAAVLGSPKK